MREPTKFNLQMMGPVRDRVSEEHERTVRLLLTAVLAVALGLRVWLILAVPRYFDDHYVFNNIDRLLAGSLKPRHSFYGTLSYMPQALALWVLNRLHLLTGSAAFAVHGGPMEGFTLGAFRVMRSFVAGYALASIGMIYLVGRRLFSPAVGLVAAAVLAAYPQHLRSSTQLKPDMLALLFTTVALYWAAGAARDPRLSRFLLAGAGVGLATSAKYTGLSSALPLTALALWTGFRDRRRWAWLVLAGVAAVVTFFALNPFFDSVFHYVPTLVRGYARHGRSVGSDHLVVLYRELEFMDFEHGRVLVAFLLLGMVLLVRRIWRPSGDWERTAALLALALAVGYPALHAAGMMLFRNQNLLPAMAGTALVCAYGIVRSVQGLGRRLPGRTPVVTGLAWAVLGVLLLVRSFDYSYQRVVPTTREAAEAALRTRLAPLQGRYVAYEPVLGTQEAPDAEIPESSQALAAMDTPEDAELRLAERWQQAAATAVPSLAALPPSALDLMDAELFPLSRLEGPQAAFYQERRRRLAWECRMELRDRPFHRRGTPLLLLLHPWAQIGEEVRIDLRRQGRAHRGLIARLPADLGRGDLLSIELIRPARERPTPALVLQPGARRIELQYAGRRRWQARFLSPRFEHDPASTEIRVPASAQAEPQSFYLLLRHWTPGACPER